MFMLKLINATDNY